MDLFKLEQQRQGLEDNLQKLRQSLKHWQTWEAEYEGLKEELQGVHGNPTASQLATIARSYDGELVNEREIRELSGLDKDSPRTAKQILGLVERRQEYVQKNIETIQKQYFDAEAKSEELAFAARNQNSANQAGLPLTEIHEELDDDGNVISSQLSQPEKATATVVESLRKVGLSEDDVAKISLSKPNSEELKPAITNVSPSITATYLRSEKRGSMDCAITSPSGDGTEVTPERPPLRKKSVSFAADTKEATEALRLESEDGTKKVSFAEKVAVMPAAPPPDTRSVSFSPKVEEIPPQPLGPPSPNVQPQTVVGVTERAVESSQQREDPGKQDDDSAESTNIVIPEDESPEDARTRREMLEYHLNEVGNVVAQIDLDEADAYSDSNEDGVSYRTNSEYLDEEDTPYTTGFLESGEDSEESEDEFGRSKRPQITPEYRKQMQELERRLIGNIGPPPAVDDENVGQPEVDAGDARRLVIRDKRQSSSSVSSDSSEKKSNSKKRVSFAESLDVATPGSPPLKAQKHQEGENVAPVADRISERTSTTSEPLPSYSEAVGTPSRFKGGRAAPTTIPASEQPASAGSAIEMDDVVQSPSGPPGVTIANTLLERTPAKGPASAPSEDDSDPVIQRRELAEAYYRRRNDMVRQQGGFKAEEDDGEGELMEERDGKLKKVSRFKAARIKS